MSYAFPVIVETSLNSNVLLGIVMSFSSLVGIIFDIGISTHFKRGAWRQFLRLGITLSIGFPILTVIGANNGSIAVFLLASAIWGIYFELNGISEQDFIATTQPQREFARDWAIIYSFGAFCTLVSPIVGSMLTSDSTDLLLIVVFLQVAALLFSSLLTHPKHTEVADEKPSLIRPNMLLALERRIFPVIALVFCFHIASSTFWTIGALFGRELGTASWLVLSLFGLGTVFGDFLLIRFPIVSHKKVTAIVALFLTGILLALLAVCYQAQLDYALIFVAALCLSVVSPLAEAVFSDLNKRAPELEPHIISLSRISMSTAFIAGPLMAGITADIVGYRNTFAIVGVFIIFAAVGLWVITPKKLRLPQQPT